VDDDELWIGSALGGKASSTFHGAIDEVVLHRGIVPVDQLRRRSPVTADIPAPPMPEHPADAVLVQIHEGIPENKSWNFQWDHPIREYLQDSLGFVQVPHKYSSRAVRIDRSDAFALRSFTKLFLEPGEHEFLVRARNGTRLWIDGDLLIETPFHSIGSDGHNDLRDVAVIDEPGIRQLQTGDNEVLARFRSAGGEHEVRFEVYVGGKRIRPELGETGVFVRRPEGEFHLVGHGPTAPLTDAGWLGFADRQRDELRDLDADRRREVGRGESEYWTRRHEYARDVWTNKEAAKVPELPDGFRAANPIDHFLAAKLDEQDIEPNATIDDWAFLRRATLDVIGTVPTEEQITAYFADSPDERRENLVDRLLEHPGWADHWVGYWQDVLAENPNLVNPTLNNTGPFRYWIHESFYDNKPVDRFVTELVRMEGSEKFGGPKGFEMASQNDVPMASKAHIIGQAFLGLEMKCARCHDAPFHDLKQRQLFGVAAMLGRKSQEVPASSSVAIAPDDPNPPLIELSIFPGDKIAPEWPFESLSNGDLGIDRLTNSNDPRERLAAFITSPHNERFPRVIANRLWKRYMGRGLVEPVEDWEAALPSHPELLVWLAAELVTSGYDMKHLARLVLTSTAYEREATSDVPNVTYKPFFFEGPVRKRMTAEQLVDSLFLVSGKRMKAGLFAIDADGSRPADKSLNLGRPRRAWEFGSTSNERDRPSLTLPKAEPFVGLMSAFGWRPTRQDPANERETAPNVIQSGQLATGVIGGRFTRLSDDSDFTRLALRAESPEQLADKYFRRILSRPPTADELAAVTDVLADGFDSRTTEAEPPVVTDRDYPSTGVSWSNHLKSEANTRQQELAEVIAKGDPPTQLLDAEWRERAEDVLWSLLNSPEFVIVP